MVKLASKKKTLGARSALRLGLFVSPSECSTCSLWNRTGNLLASLSRSSNRSDQFHGHSTAPFAFSEKGDQEHSPRDHGRRKLNPRLAQK